MTAPNQDEIWVFVADPIRIDLRIFNSWVNGVKGKHSRTIILILIVIIIYYY
jgi:hypothetical protein